VCSCSEYASFCSSTEPVNSCLGCGQSGPPGGNTSDGAAGSAGSGDGGTGNPAAGGRSGSAFSGCGCSVIGGDGPSGPLAGFALAGLAAMRRRTRRASSSAHRVPG
jgi:MYXO-CTERM domain-containing protein